MSTSCRSCGTCPRYLETHPPSGMCDYCDCPQAEHMPAVETTSPMKSIPISGYNPMQSLSPPQQQPTMQQPPVLSPPMQFGQNPFMQQSMYGMPSVGPVSMLPQPQVNFVEPQFNPQLSQMGMFSPQQQFGIMPLMPPNQMSGPSVVSRSCSNCGAIFPDSGPPNKLNLCNTCVQNTPPSVCSKCKTNNANPGFNWCQSCFETDTKCRKCGKNAPNEGYRWCESCYHNQQVDNPIDCFPQTDAMTTMGPVTPVDGCPVCGKARFFDKKIQKFFDFCGQTCATQHYSKNGVLKLKQHHEEYIEVSGNFKTNWNLKKGACPPITCIFKVRVTGADDKFDKYTKKLHRDVAHVIQYYYHGCKITCDLLNTQSLCTRPDCTICLVSKQGFDISKVGTNVAFTRFGKCLYFAPDSSKCHDYTLGVETYGYRAMFCVRCAPGFKQILFKDDINRTAPDPGYDSLYGLAGVSLNYDELCLYNDSACVPEYIVIYQRDGVGRRCN